MSKFSIGQVLSETFKTFFTTWPSLLKSNWLLLGVMIGLEIVYYSFMPDSDLKRQIEAGNFSSSDCWILVYFALKIILSGMFAGWVLHFIVNNNDRPLGFGGLYINVPLLKMITVNVLFWIILLMVGGGSGVLFVAQLPSANGLGGLEVLNLFNGAWFLLIPGYLQIIFYVGFLVLLLSVGIFGSIYLYLRFTTIWQYSFLNNEMSISKPFRQTKGYAWRILVIMFIIGLIILYFNMLPKFLEMSVSMPALLVTISSIVMIAVSYLGIVTGAVIYKHLNRDK